MVIATSVISRCSVEGSAYAAVRVRESASSESMGS